ncbi:MAG: hypothetical protein JW840_02160 [Candidatus Thermoplasmatota archaeon]|nr:hypothetical protein [Candidatus Thermoplasmatota archaeon]
MNRNLINKKSIAVGIILLFVGICFIPSTATSLRSGPNTAPSLGIFFGLNSHLAIYWDANVTEEPIIPRGGIRTVCLDIPFWITWGLFGRLINYLLRYKLVTITLSVVDKPEWSTTALSQGTVFLSIPPKENVNEIGHTQLSVAVYENAPAFALLPVTIQATIEPVHGLFGLLTVLQGTTQVTDVTFTVAYKPLIQPIYPQTNIIETPPLIPVELPIGIQNLGNGRTTVVNEIVDYPEGWIVTIPAQLMLEVGGYNEMNLSIVAPFNFSGQETITVSFTPHSSDDYTLVGQTIYATFIAYYHPR